MQIRQTLQQAAEQLERSDCPNPRLDSETLLMHVLGRDRAYLYAHPELELACGELSRYYEAITARARGTPLQYITGQQEFWGLDFKVSPAVLIPRPETEHSVEAVLEIASSIAGSVMRIVDVGTGSGCIALALASELPQAKIYALDISPDALAIAQENAQLLGLGQRVQFGQSDLLTSFLQPPQQFDIVVSNPPYVGSDEPEKVQREVREHEPEVAVFAGPSGMEVYGRLIPQAHEILKPDGWLVLEIGYSIEAQVRNLLTGWSKVQVKPDLQGIPRVVMAKK